MASNQQLDSIQHEKLDLSYDRSQAELSTDPRFVSGRNTYVTLGGKLCKRLGNTLLNGTNITGKRIDRLWIYETSETPPKVFICASMYDLAMLDWQMYYINMDDVSPTWTQFSNLRAVNQSSRAHEAISSRGLFYVKSYPPSSTGELLGTVLLDGSGVTPTVKPWGLLSPTIPAALAGAVANLTTDITSGAISLVVSTATGFPATPFPIQIGYEELLVTAKVGTTFTATRGTNGTTAEAHAAGELVVWRDWSASAHQVTVNVTWAYTYAFKSITGQVSDRAPLETNPDKLPSRTGPFQDLIPKFVLQGDSDTTNIPTIVVFRSTDGGGTFFFLEEIPNTGAGPITYQDKSFESGVSGGVFQDPVPDSELDTATKAPTLTLNGPPPTVVSPQVTGVDTPIASTPLASYSGRLWLGLGNIVFYSGDEEITLGIPEECWPSGEFGNFFRLQYPVTNVASTATSLYIFTTQTTYQITGTNKETFNIQPLFESLGAPVGQPRAISRYEDTLIVLTQDYRVVKIRNNQAEVITDKLSTDLVDAVSAGLLIDIKFWGTLEKQWIIVSAHDTTDSSNSRQWIYDIKKSDIVQSPFWFVPWDMRISATTSGNDSTLNPQSGRHFIMAMYNQSGAGSTCLVKLDSTGSTGTDYFVTAETDIGYEVITNVFMVPPGNHVNKLRAPAMTPVVYGLCLDRLLFENDTDPVIQYYLDDLWTFPYEPTNFEPPARRGVSRGYRTMIFGIEKVCQHIAFRISSLPTSDLFECMNFVLAFAPDLGI